MNLALTLSGGILIIPPVNATRCSDGAIAQLGERLHGMQEVSGSIPLSSTKIETLALWRGFLLLQLPYALNRSCFTLRHFLASVAKGFYH